NPRRNSTLRKASAVISNPCESCSAMFTSTACLVNHGRTASIADTTMLRKIPSTTCHLYGRMYFSNRFIKRLSYALPSISSSCINQFKNQNEKGKHFTAEKCRDRTSCLLQPQN